MLTYRHPKYAHTLEVQEFETVRKSVLERKGWRADKPQEQAQPTQATAPGQAEDRRVALNKAERDEEQREVQEQPHPSAKTAEEVNATRRRK